MKNIRLFASMLCLYGGLNAGAAGTLDLRAAQALRAIADSVDVDDDEAPVDTAIKTRRNTATEFNALKYVLENRYRGYGDKFTKRWDDHLFLEFGAGYHEELGRSAGNLSGLTMAHVGIGKQFSRLHTARINLGLGFGYYEDSRYNYSRFSATADWLFSLSSYLDGHKPSRLLDVSTVLGLGYRYRLTRTNIGVRPSKDVHVGLQFKFFTGPQGYLAVEPYAGISSRHMENKYGAFYGANINFIYYLHNNLSIEERMRFMNKVLDGDTEVKTKPEWWRTPWFAEVSGAVAFFKGSKGNSPSPGHSTSLALGHWLSSAIGLRLSGSLTQTTWQKMDIPMGITNEEQRVELGVPEQPNATRNYHNICYDLRADALINLFGFGKKNTWNDPFGMSIVVGGGVGWLRKNQDQPLRTYTTFYDAGLHMYYRLSDGLQVFVEPRFTHYNYKIPYGNTAGAKRFGDNVITANIGLTAYTHGSSYRNTAKTEYVAPKLPLSVGLGVGTSLIPTENSYCGAPLNYNFNAFAEYHFTKLHSVRVAFEYMQVNGITAGSYHAVDLTQDTKGYNAVGLFKHGYRRGFLSLDYSVNVTNLISGYQGRRMFEAELFAGPTIMFAIGATHDLDGSVRLKSQHAAQANFWNKTDPLMGANGGVKLRFNATKHLGVTMTPQIHVLRWDPLLNGVEMNKFRAFETLDFGVQYDF